MLVVWPKQVAERLIGLATRAPAVELSGAEIAVMLSTLDDFDALCIDVLNRILYAEETEKRMLEIVTKIVKSLRVRKSLDSRREAERVVDNLRKLWILRGSHGSRKLRVPKAHSSLRIINPESFVFFIGESLRRWVRTDGEKLVVSGVAVGYAYCKSAYDDGLKMALAVARGLSFEDPSIVLRRNHFRCVSFGRFGLCEDCLTGSRRWVGTAELAIAVNRLYSTNYGRVMLSALRREVCRFAVEEDEDDRRIRAARRGTVRKAFRMLKELAELRPVEVSLLPHVSDDSLSFVRFPDVALRNGRVCGLALSLAVETVGRSGRVTSEDTKAVEAVIRSVMRVRHGIFEPTLGGALEILARAAEERHKLLKLR